MTRRYWNRKRNNRILLLSITILIFAQLGQSVGYAVNAPLKDKYRKQTSDERLIYSIEQLNETYYSEITEQLKEKGHKTTQNIEVTLTTDNIIASSKGHIPVQSGIGGLDKDALLWEKDYKWFDWSFELPEEGLYCIELEYYPLPGSGTNIHREIMINGKVPFLEAHNIAFYRLWNDVGVPKINNIGDEIRPKQKEIKRWVTTDITDSYGIHSQPLLFYFNKGENTIRINMLDQPMAIGNIYIKSPKIIPTYQEVLSKYKKKGYKAAEKSVKFQAESNIIEKNDSTIRLESDNDPVTEPISRGNVKLNIIGSGRWSKANQSITWEFDVEEDGLYQIAARLAQWYTDAIPSYRKIEIDGKVPFAELEAYNFKYGDKWRVEALQCDTGEPYLFYLEKGTHTLKMTVKMGPIAEVYEALNHDIKLISDVIRSIYMITGDNPDPNYRYELQTKVLDLIDNLKKLAESMEIQGQKLLNVSTRNTVMANNMLSIKSQLEKMINNPDLISNQINDLNNAQGSIGNFIQELEISPLTFDYFEIVPPNAKLLNLQSNFLQRITTTIVNLISSFTKDYDSVDGVLKITEGQDGKNATKTLEVWIARGKEWAGLVKELTDEDFTAKTGISIKMNVLPASQLNAGSVNVLMLSIISGQAPDVVMGSASGSPVEFAIRDAAKDISQFEGFENAKKRFIPGLITPFEYQGGVYALPETLNFSALFYRKDILNEIGVEIPNTWEELYNYTLPTLYQNRLEFAPPEGFPAFLYQNGGDFYTKDRLKSALDTPEAFRAFKEYTELFTSYGIPVSVNLFNRMRTGVTPMGIGDYNLYVMLSVAAPELLGRWGIAPIPGHRRSDGTIDRSTSIPGSQAIMMMKQTNKPEEAWKFIDWWTSNEIQAEFGKEIEALMGPRARWNTANLDAFRQLPWQREDLKVIEQQWQWIKEPPVVLGGYFTSRHIQNAYTRVVMEGIDARDSLEQAVKDINKELKIKQEEYGIMPKEGGF